MEFDRITPDNAGRYYCTASNPDGNVTKTAEVIVHHNEIPDRTVHGRVQEVLEGETISLECTEPTAPGARVRLRFSYQKENFDLLNDSICTAQSSKLERFSRFSIFHLFILYCE